MEPADNYRLTFTISRRQDSALDVLKHETGVPKAESIRRAIDMYLAWQHASHETKKRVFAAWQQSD